LAKISQFAFFKQAGIYFEQLPGKRVCAGFAASEYTMRLKNRSLAEG